MGFPPPAGMGNGISLKGVFFIPEGGWKKHINILCKPTPWTPPTLNTKQLSTKWPGKDVQETQATPMVLVRLSPPMIVVIPVISAPELCAPTASAIVQAVSVAVCRPSAGQ